MALLSISGIPSEVKENDIKQLFSEDEYGECKLELRVLKFHDGKAVVSIKNYASKGTIVILCVKNQDSQ